MILRHDADGLYEIYDIGNNTMLAANFLGQVGTDFQVAGLGGFFGSDTTDMLLRSANTGEFEVYDISNNNITNAATLGTVGPSVPAGLSDVWRREDQAPASVRGRRCCGDRRSRATEQKAVLYLRTGRSPRLFIRRAVADHCP
jgi:hypothetical protein